MKGRRQTEHKHPPLLDAILHRNCLISTCNNRFVSLHMYMEKDLCWGIVYFTDHPLASLLLLFWYPYILLLLFITCWSTLLLSTSGREGDAKLSFSWGGGFKYSRYRMLNTAPQNLSYRMYSHYEDCKANKLYHHFESFPQNVPWFTTEARMAFWLRLIFSTLRRSSIISLVSSATCGRKDRQENQHTYTYCHVHIP